MGRHQDRLKDSTPFTQQEHYRATLEATDLLEDLCNEFREHRRDTRDAVKGLAEEIRYLRSDLTGEGGVIQRLLKMHGKTVARLLHAIIIILVVLAAVFGVKLGFF